jgi:hypothetical protein
MQRIRRSMMTPVQITRKPTAILAAAGIALSALSIGPTPVLAAPVSSNSLALKEAVPDDVVPVHRRWRRNDGAFVAALALGVIGAVIAHKEYKRHRRHHYYHYGYYGAPSCIRRHGAWYCR